jgi:intracellular sulfur oxidation DsrE/DsrF family protein
VTLSEPDRPARRQFLGQAAKSLAVAGLASALPAIAAEASPRRRRAAAPWDMAWVEQLAGSKHKGVFDATMITNGLALGHVDLYMRGYHDIYELDDRDIRPVLVIRHEAVPMFLNDAFWQKYQLGQKLRIGDPVSGTLAARNPFAAPGSKPIDDWMTLQQLKSRGVIILGCDKALRSVATLMAQSTNQAPETVIAEARAAVVPTVTMMPSGIFAVMRAQEAGCAYIRST